MGEVTLDTASRTSNCCPMATLGQKIKSLRNARQMTLRALGIELERLGGNAKFSAIAKWEKDSAVPSRENLKALCEYFNVEPSWLVFGEISTGDQVSQIMDEVRLLSPRQVRLLAKIVEAMRDEDERSKATDTPNQSED